MGWVFTSDSRLLIFGMRHILSPFFMFLSKFECSVMC